MVAGHVGADVWARFPRKTFPALIADRAQCNGDKIFLVDAVTGETASYRTFHEEGMRWAAALAESGAAPSARVAVIASTSIAYFSASLGIGWLNGIEVAVNTELRGPLLIHALKLASAEYFLVDETFVGNILEIIDEIPAPKTFVVIAQSSARRIPRIQGSNVINSIAFLASGGTSRNFDPPELHDIASICFTSGTTGPAKGVIQPWLQLYRNALMAWQVHRVTSDDTLHVSSSAYHSTAKVFPYYVALAGCRLVFREKFSPSRLLDEVRAYDCTAVLLIGAMSRFLLKQEAQSDDAASSWRLALMNPAPPEVDEFKRRFGVEAITCYGMTEISAPFCSAGYEVSSENASSCGRLVDGVEARLVDANDYEVPVGQPGELILRTDEPWALNAGYLGMPEATAQAWRNGWFHTGDLFHRDASGLYYFVDRLKNAIRRRGENVSSYDVELFVISHAEVSEVAAIAAPSDDLEDEIKICVVRTRGSDLRPDTLSEFLAFTMPRFMVPRYIEFVDELPITPTARIRKTELRDNALNPQTWDRVTGTYFGCVRRIPCSETELLKKAVSVKPY